MMSEPGSFAHLTLTQRLPEIARRVIAENDFPPSIVKNLETLVQELPDGIVRRLKDDDGADLTAWGRYVEPFLEKRWLDVPWYFAEAYFYRRILEATDYFLSGAPSGVDPFELQKRRGLETAMDSIRSLSTRVNSWSDTQLHGDGIGNPTSLIALLYFALWGNRADLSLWPVNVGEADHSSQDTHPEQAHILVDDTSILADRVASFHGVRIDFIVDNAGFELVCDLCLADFLLESAVAGMVCLHLKPHPTFVSDAMIKDVHHTLEVLAADGEGDVQSLAERLQHHIASGRLLLCEDSFWTSPLAFWEMPEPLQQQLTHASLVIIKGHANYRRLLGDRHWPFTTSFADIVCYFPAPFTALRTLKSEIVVGLQPGQAESLSREDPQWLTNGQWGVINLFSAT
jgi:uncharacterized protein with ATP-grasp and redox domains